MDDFFIVTKEGYHLDIIEGTVVKLLNFAYKGERPSTVVMKVTDESKKDVKAILCTLTPEKPQYSGSFVVAGDAADFELVGEDPVTVYMDVDIDEDSSDSLAEAEGDSMFYSDMEEEGSEGDDEEGSDEEKEEEKKPQPPKASEKKADKKKTNKK